MTDVFREVDEDLRRDQLRRLWKRYGRYVIGGAVLIVLAVAAYGLIGSIQASRSAADGDRYLAAIDLRAAGDAAAAEAAFAALMADGTGGYPTLAAFQIASMKLEAGDAAAAAAAYDAIALDGDTDPSLRDTARYHAAMALLDTAPLADIQARLEPLATEGGAFKYLAIEGMALSAFRVGETVRALGWLTQINEERETVPGDIYQRAQQIYAVLLAQGGLPGEATATTPAAPLDMRVGAAPTPTFLEPQTLTPPAIDLRRQTAPVNPFGQLPGLGNPLAAP